MTDNIKIDQADLDWLAESIERSRRFLDALTQLSPSAPFMAGYRSEPQLTDLEIDEFIANADLDERIDAGQWLEPTPTIDTWPVNRPEPIRPGDVW